MVANMISELKSISRLSKIFPESESLPQFAKLHQSAVKYSTIESNALLHSLCQ